MRVLIPYVFFVVTIILTSYALSASAGPTKDHKKKLLEKLRNALNQTELEEAGNVTLEEVQAQIENNATDVAAAPEEESPEAKTTSEEEASEKTEAVSEDKKESDEGEEKKPEEKEKSETSSTELVKNEGPASYLRRNLVKMKTVLKRLFDLFGFRQSKKKEGRQNRMLGDGNDSYSYNGLEYEYFKDDIRTTVGAVLGEKECIQKIVCGAGSYLREVNGKHVILTILENVTPSAWVDTVELLKKSAVTDGDCQYKCLEEDAH